MVNDEIKFWHGGGFTGESYILQINDKYYHLCTNLGGKPGEDEAKESALKKLNDLGIEFNGDIIFDWNGNV